MKQKFLIFSLAALLLLVAMPAAAGFIPDPKSPVDRLQNVGVAAGFGENVTTTSIATTVGQIIKTFLSLLGIIFMAYVVYAGFLWMTASGKEETIVKAKAIIRGSVIGLIVALASYIITATVVDRLTIATSYGAAYHSTIQLS